jgi:hypothetical protein
MGSITSLQGFNEHNLVIKYYIDCPAGWMTQEDILTGVSWKSRPNKDDVCHISLPLDIHLYHEWDETSSKDLEWPIFFVKVKSVDRYNRESVVGEGSVMLPCSPGHHVIDIQTMKRVPNSPLDRMSQYFLGYVEKEEDTNWITCRRLCRRKKSDEESVQSVQEDEEAVDPEEEIKAHRPNHTESTETSGVATLSLYCLIRAESSIERQRKKRSDLLTSIKQVIEAFEKAKSKMMEISQKIRDEEKTLEDDDYAGDDVNQKEIIKKSEDSKYSDSSSASLSSSSSSDDDF